MSSKDSSKDDKGIKEEGIIQMKGGILGFEHLERFIFLARDETIPFWQFQAVDDGTMFVVIDPFLVKPDYQPILPDAATGHLEIERPEDVLLVTIVTVRDNPLDATVNLRAPLAINVKRRVAMQVILEDSHYPVQYPLRRIMCSEEKHECSGESIGDG